MLVCLSSCSRGAENIPCDKQADDLDKAYDAIVTERSPDPKRVFKQFNELKQKTESAIKNCPDNIRLYSILSSVYMGLGRNNDALTSAQKAFAINSESAAANSLMGDSLSVLNRFAEAFPYLEKAVRLQPDNIFYQLNLCSTYEMAKQYEKAIDTCSKIIKNIKKKDEKFLGDALYVRARAYQAIGRKNEAKKDFDHAKALGVDLSEYYTPEHLGQKP